jgi:hypothetical protein
MRPMLGRCDHVGLTCMCHSCKERGNRNQRIQRKIRKAREKRAWRREDLS